MAWDGYWRAGRPSGCEKPLSPSPNRCSLRRERREESNTLLLFGRWLSLARELNCGLGGFRGDGWEGWPKSSSQAQGVRHRTLNVASPIVIVRTSQGIQPGRKTLRQEPKLPIASLPA